MPLIASGIGVTAFFCFMFSWVEMLLAKNLTSVDAQPIAAVMTRTASTSGYELGLLAAAGVLTIIPGAIVIYFVRNYIAKGFALAGLSGAAPSRAGARPRTERRRSLIMPIGLGWMAWTWQTAVFFAAIVASLLAMTLWEFAAPGRPSARRRARPHHHPRRPALHLAAGGRLHPPRLAGASPPGRCGSPRSSRSSSR